jgi:hypothetical protein
LEIRQILETLTTPHRHNLYRTIMGSALDQESDPDTALAMMEEEVAPLIEFVREVKAAGSELVYACFPPRERPATPPDTDFHRRRSSW